MWFRRVSALAFGLLRNKELELGPGLNVVHGPNETGKSTWHAALSTGLCGQRRGRGRRSADTEFERQFRPWGAGEDGLWSVTVELTLDDGRPLEIKRDLRVNDTEIHDPVLGRRLPDIESELTRDGSPDGAMLVGLNRETFAMAASVRQASVIADLEQPDALQEQLARAAAGSDGATAAGAIGRIEAFQKEHVGPVRKGGIRPLQKALEVKNAAQEHLGAVRQHHSAYLEDVGESDRLRGVAADLEERQRLAMAAVEWRQADAEVTQFHGKVDELESLISQTGNLEDGVPELPDVTRLAQALSRVKALPEPAMTTLGHPDELEARAAALDAEIQGFPPTPDVEQVQQWVAPLRTAGAMPAVGPGTTSLVGSLRRRSVRTAIVAVMGLLVAVGLGVTVSPVAGLAVGLVAGVAAWLVGRRPIAAPVPDRVEPPGTVDIEAVHRRLDEVGLPLIPDTAVNEAAKRREDLGHLQNQRTDAQRDLERRREFDSGEDARRETAASAWAALREAAALHDIDVAGEDELMSPTQAVLDDHQAVLRRRDKTSEARGALEEALDGRTLSDWRSLASVARQAASEAQRAFELAGGSIDEVDSAADVQGSLEELEGQLRGARDDVATAVGRLSGVDPASVDIAAAEAALTEADAELERVRQLDATLSVTARFMRAAADNAHRALAPRIAATMSTLVSRVTNGRYQSVRVDPADLRVTLVTGSGDLRDAKLFSRGTTEQVYLALRAVLAEVLSTGREQCPLLLDDPTVHADNVRTAVILDWLREVADERQVILFSQEQEVLDWARTQPEGSISLIELPARDRA